MSSTKLYPELFEQATGLYRPLGKFAWQFARGKLGGDPVFAALLEHGLIPAKSKVLDIGCGQGLLAALLCSLQNNSSALQHWPASWSPAPVDVQLRGIDLMPRDIARAQGAMAHLKPQVEFMQGDMRSADFGHAGQTDVAVLLDVLHYVDFDAQHDILRRVRAALSVEGRLLLRVGNAAAGLPFYLSNWVDTLVTLVRRQRWVRLYCRSIVQWQSLLSELGLKVDALPMHKGTPYANVLLVARVERSERGTYPNTTLSGHTA